MSITTQSIPRPIRPRLVLLLLALAMASGSAQSRAANAACTTSSTAHCLQGGRFRVEVDWRGFGTDGGQAKTVNNPTGDTGLFYFFGPNNWEILIKVLNACGTANGANNRFWVFAAAATTLEYSLTVTDTMTGIVKTYFNPLGRSSPAITDTEAFSTCSGAPEPTPTPSGCPVNGPLTDLRQDCSNTAYEYSLGAVEAALTSNGSVAFACFGNSNTGIICVRGPVQSKSRANLTQTNVDGSPYVGLDAGSYLELSTDGKTLDIRSILDGTVYDFFGFKWFRNEPLSIAAAKNLSRSSSSKKLLERLNGVLSEANPGTEAEINLEATLRKLSNAK